MIKPLHGAKYRITLDYIAIVNYPCYYCNGFQPHNRELKSQPEVHRILAVPPSTLFGAT
jgi:hypothetical protein